jgi:hypothetical protein
MDENPLELSLDEFFAKYVRPCAEEFIARRNAGEPFSDEDREFCRVFKISLTPKP